jgi:hypothetical protein
VGPTLFSGLEDSVESSCVRLGPEVTIEGSLGGSTTSARVRPLGLPYHVQGTATYLLLVRPLESGSRAVGGALEFPEFSLADRTAAVEPCAIQLEALAAVARFVTQPVSLVASVPSRVIAVD